MRAELFHDVTAVRGLSDHEHVCSWLIVAAIPPRISG
jgi:hypothetical protein